MKSNPWEILSGCGCGFLTLVVGTAISALTFWSLYEYAGVRDIAGFPNSNHASTVVPIAVGISGCLGILLGCRVGFQ